MLRTKSHRQEPLRQQCVVTRRRWVATGGTRGKLRRPPCRLANTSRPRPSSVLIFVVLLATVVSSLSALLTTTIAEDWGNGVGVVQWMLTLTTGCAPRASDVRSYRS
jgi:hypothetical protein